MNILKESDFRKQIKTSPCKAYLFFGEEDYLKGFAVQTAIDAVCKDRNFAAFDYIRLDMLSYSADALMDAIMPLPMMSERKLITVTGLDFTAMKQGETDALCSVLAALDEYDYNTVIINVPSDKFDGGVLPRRPSKLLLKLSEYLTPVYFEKVSPARLVSWVGKHYAHNGVSASPEICEQTVSRCGRDMYNLASETDKISFYVKSQNRDIVTSGDVEHVAVSVAEFDAFALSNALTAGKREDALRVLADMRFRRVDPIIIMSEIISNICDSLSVELLAEDGLTVGEMSELLKIHEYKISLILRSERGVSRLRSMLEKCRKADLEIKSSRDGYAVIQELICGI